ncbi:hypothetical protein INR77_09000 [Erythrobacter sp. SCSIO 43205]|uniref:hypothetical protein n=1 Tax=Erythrobacter sp. SCSIO 43205 TaxID=2779361 RepID=UPI001CAA29CE|nr:hypothetical protein [Erythrobacter sp. SCSIO 43205]UAB76984.1 hypothetical protein INR77_09000 [Erythrobacter sp. SCSIO 43205]
MTAPKKSNPRYWTKEEEKRLRYLRESLGLTPAAISEILDRTAYSVKAKIAALDIDLPKGFTRGQGTTLPASQMIEVKRAWMRGETIADCAERLSLFEPRVARAYRLLSKQERERATLPPQIGTYIGAKEMALIVAPICGIKPTAIKGPSRLKPYVCARIAIARALRERGFSSTVIARALGRTNHTTALHWFKQFGPYSRHYPETLAAYEAIKNAEAITAERRAA